MRNTSTWMNLGTKHLALVVLLLTATSAMAQLEIEIRRGVARPVPIAVVPFAWEPAPASPGGAAAAARAAPFDVAALVARDLGSSGRFAPIPVADMLSQPSRPTEVRLDDWRILDVDVLVIGRLTEERPGQYSITFQLFDVLRGEQLLGYRMDSTEDQLRASSHRVADMIFERLTGIPGVFATRIAYINEQRNGDNRRYRLIVADADGENAQVIADSPRPLMSPAWSPDGRRLAYVSFEGDQSAIYVQTLRTGTRERVSARPGINGAPAFSPDGRRLALTLSRDNGNLEVFTLDLATQVLTQLTNDPAIDTEPTWSADGRSIYFTSDRGGSAQIYRVGTDPGMRPQRITFEGVYNARARVSPDGAQLAVVHQAGQGFRIAVVDPSNGLTQVLTDGRLDESPAFAPNGAQIIYATRDGGRGVLASVTTDGRIQQEIASVAGDVREPVWSPFPRP